LIARQAVLGEARNGTQGATAASSSSNPSLLPPIFREGLEGLQWRQPTVGGATAPPDPPLRPPLHMHGIKANSSSKTCTIIECNNQYYGIDTTYYFEIIDTTSIIITVEVPNWLDPQQILIIILIQKKVYE
jgi:hypothetical protein